MDDMPDVGDAQALLAYMGEVGRRARQKAAARPGWRDFGAELCRVHECFERSVWGGPSSDRYRQAPLVPLPGARGREDGRDCPTINPRGELVRDEATGLLVAVRGHLKAIGFLACEAMSVHPILALSRVLFDNSVRLHFILDPSSDEKTRVVRAANLRLEAWRQENADEDSNTEDKGRIEANRLELLSAARADGLNQATQRRNGQPNPWSLDPPFDVPRMIRITCDEPGIFAWRYLSSIVHAQERIALDMTAGTASFGTGSMIDMADRDQLNIAMAHLAVKLFTDVIPVVLGYFGALKEFPDAVIARLDKVATAAYA